MGVVCGDLIRRTLGSSDACVTAAKVPAGQHKGRDGERRSATEEALWSPCGGEGQMETADTRRQLLRERARWGDSAHSCLGTK